MILVDTNVWINHFRVRDVELSALLNRGVVACHPFVVGEVACGNLESRVEILSLLQALPSLVLVEPDELLAFIECRRLMGKGLGYVDMHLLASTLLSGVVLWTADKRLRRAAKSLDVCYFAT